MSTLRFTDGINIDTSGDHKKIRLDDGWYVVGGGVCVPVVDENEADQLLKDLLKT